MVCHEGWWDRGQSDRHPAPRGTYSMPILAKSVRTVFCYFFSTEFSTALEVMDCSWVYWPKQWCQLAIDSLVYCTFSQRNVCSRGIWCITNDFDRFWRFWRAVQAKAINNAGTLLKCTKQSRQKNGRWWLMVFLRHRQIEVCTMVFLAVSYIEWHTVRIYDIIAHTLHRQ